MAASAPTARGHEMAGLFEFVGDDVSDQRIVVHKKDLEMRHTLTRRMCATRGNPMSVDAKLGNKRSNAIVPFAFRQG